MKCEAYEYEESKFKNYLEEAEHQDFYGNEYTDEPFDMEYDPDNPVSF